MPQYVRGLVAKPKSARSTCASGERLVCRATQVEANVFGGGRIRDDDDLRADRDATSFGYVAGAGYKLFPRSLVMAEFEHNLNRIVGQRFRVMLWLTLALSSR